MNISSQMKAARKHTKIKANPKVVEEDQYEVTWKRK